MQQRESNHVDESRNGMFLGSSVMFIGILILTFFSVFLAKAQLSFAQLNQKMQSEKKPMVVYISSKYCLYCLMQEKKIKKNPELLQRLNSQYYYATMMAEKEKDIVFDNQHFLNPHPKDNYAVNDFVNVYGKNEDGIVAYPLWLFFDSDYQLQYRYSGLLAPDDMTKILDAVETFKTIH